jgi:hypothetical protein
MTAERLAGGSVSNALLAVCDAPARSPAMVRPMAMPIPTAAHAAAAITAAVALTHSPTADSPTSSASGQNQADLATAEIIRPSVGTTRTYSRSVEAVGHVEHCISKSLTHGSPQGVDLPGLRA